MTEDVLITVTGLHAVNGEKDAEDKVEITSAGKYYKKNGKHFVLYDEVAEETGDIIKNRLKLSDSAMEIHKTGPMKTSMVFENGKKKYELVWHTVRKYAGGHRSNWNGCAGKRRSDRCQYRLHSGNEL